MYILGILPIVFINIVNNILFKKNTANKIINIPICKAKIINQIFLCWLFLKQKITFLFNFCLS